MLKPTVKVRVEEGGTPVADFWDCLRLDPAPVQELRKHYEAHLQAQGRPDLIVDLNGVSFAGSAALGGFLTLNRLVRQKGGRLIFCNVDVSVHEVFRISKLEPLFLFVADLPAAQSLLSEPPPEPGSEPKPERPMTGPAASTPLRRRGRQ